MRHITKLAGLFLTAAVLCSCSSISVVATWRNKSVQATRLHKVLVVSITSKDANRAVLEDILASELGQRGVAAVASYSIMPGGVKSDTSVLDKAVKKAAVDSVLTVQTIKVEHQTTVQPGFNNYPGYWYPEAFPSWDLYGYYGAMSSYGTTFISSYDVATIQVNFFATATGKLLWAATVTSNEPENVTSVAKDLAKVIAKALEKQGFI
jgi:hypothetical protein